MKANLTKHVVGYLFLNFCLFLLALTILGILSFVISVKSYIYGLLIGMGVSQVILLLNYFATTTFANKMNIKILSILLFILKVLLFGGIFSLILVLNLSGNGLSWEAFNTPISAFTYLIPQIFTTLSIIIYELILRLMKLDNIKNLSDYDDLDSLDNEKNLEYEFND